MDARDVYNLYEAYRSVYVEQEALNEDVDYELDEGYKKLPIANMLKQASRHGENVGRSGGDQESSLKRAKRVGRMMSAAERHDPIKSQGKAYANFGRADARQQKEELDIYDLVLDHLLDEGYCDDVESAEVIMANMSEEWVDEIVEAVEIMSVTSPEGKLRKGTRIRPPQTEHRRTFRRLAALQKRQRENPKAISTRSAREQSSREVEKNTKKSLKNLNADPNVEVKHGYADIDSDGYRSVSTDYRARKRRASAR